MAAKQVIPALGLESFSCPHVDCGALAHQSWFRTYALRIEQDQRAWFPTHKEIENLRGEPHAPKVWLEFLERMASREVFFETHENTKWLRDELINVNLSKCFSCGRIAIWRADELIYPLAHIAIEPNEDMPPDVKADFLEANEILDKSPRGAAALLRLCIQKLMVHLNEKGENINDDIASLVRKGLDARIQKALDVVRVVGNNAVHPGQIDWQDSKATASKLFGLVNVIVESQIAQPRHIDHLFENLVPESAKAQIVKRDAPKQLEKKV